MTNKAVFIKFGGSLITDKTRPMTAKPKAINQICAEFARLYHAHPEYCWFLGNGAGSFGHYMVHQTNWREQPANPLAIARIRQATAQLNQLIIDQLLKNDVPALTLAPAAFSTYEVDHYDTAGRSALQFAALRAVPVVYGDVVSSSDGSARIMSTEDALDELAEQWQAAGNTVERVIYCGSVDGVYGSDGAVVPSLSPSIVDDSIGGAQGYDVTGGMSQKVNAGFRALSYTSHVHIINGLVKGQLTECLLGHDVGTKLQLDS